MSPLWTLFAKKVCYNSNCNGAQVAIPAPDPPLPPSFDADSHTHRYRFLEQPGGWLARCASIQICRPQHGLQRISTVCSPLLKVTRGWLEHDLSLKCSS